MTSEKQALERESAKLDPEEEQAMADERYAGEIDFSDDESFLYAEFVNSVYKR